MALEFRPFPIPEEPAPRPNEGLQVVDKAAQMAQLYMTYKQQKQANDLAKQKQMVDIATAASERGEDFWNQLGAVGWKPPAGMTMPGTATAGAQPMTPAPTPSVPGGMGPVADSSLTGGMSVGAPGETPEKPAIGSALEITPEYLAEIRRKKGSKGAKEFIDQQTFLTGQKQANAQMDNLAITNESKIRDDYTKASTSFKVVSENIGVIQSLANRPPSPAGDISLIFAYMKLVDPGSTVKEQEAATAANAAGVPDRLRTMYNNVLRGEKLAPAQRGDFIRTSGDIYQGWLDKQQQLDEDFDGIATRSRVNPQNVRLRYGVPRFDREALAKAAGSQNFATAPPPVGGIPAAKPIQNTQAQIQAAESWLALNPNSPKAAAVRSKVQSLKAGNVTRG